MPQSIRSGSSFDSLIPALTDNADIVKALKDYHYGTISHPSTQGQENALTTGLVGIFNTKANLAGPTFTGTVILPSTTSIGNVSATELGYLDGVTSAIQTQIGNKASLSGPIFTGTVTLTSGTTSVAPLKFNTGTTKLDTILAGTVEYDGSIFYATPKVNNTTAGRGLVETPYVYVAAADAQVVISTATSNTEGSGYTTDTDSAGAFGGYIYLAANSTYMVEANVMVYHNFTRTFASTTSEGGILFTFQYPSGTTFSLDMSTIIDQTSTLATPPASAPIPYIHTQATGAITIKPTTTASSDTGYSMFRVRGIVRTSSTAGNFGPVLTTNARVFNDGPGGNQFVSRGSILANSFIKVTPLGGTTSSINIGGWA